MAEIDDPEALDQWCLERREEVLEYLARTGVRHGEVTEWPAWHVAPYVSIWPVESGKVPGAVGWWVICGDLPTDYVSATTIKEPRAAMRAIAERWQAASTRMARGEAPEGLVIGTPADWPELAPLLGSRAATLAEWADDDELWEGMD